MEFKRSSQVSATLIVAIASTMTTTGCDSRSQDCVDAAGRVVPDSQCRSGYRGYRWIPHVSSGGFGGSGGSFFGG